MSVKGRTSWVASCLSLIDGLQSTNVEAPAATTRRPSKKKASSPKTTPAKPPAKAVTGSIDQPVTKLSRVDTKTAEKFERLDVSTIRDLLYLFPRRHNDYSQQCKIANLKRGQPVTVIATVWEASQTRMGKSGKLRATQAVVGDETGNMRVVWFGQAYLARQLKTGVQIALSGKMDVFNGVMVMESPDYEILSSSSPLIHTDRLVPVYPLTGGLTARNLRRIVWNALERWRPAVEEFMPRDILQRVGVMDLLDAVFTAPLPQRRRILGAGAGSLGLRRAFSPSNVGNAAQEGLAGRSQGDSHQDRRRGRFQFSQPSPPSL